MFDRIRSGHLLIYLMANDALRMDFFAAERIRKADQARKSKAGNAWKS